MHGLCPTQWLNNSFKPSCSNDFGPKKPGLPKNRQFLSFSPTLTGPCLRCGCVISKLPPAMHLIYPSSYKHKSCFIFVAFLIDGCILPKGATVQGPKSFSTASTDNGTTPNPGSSPLWPSPKRRIRRWNDCRAFSSSTLNGFRSNSCLTRFFKGQGGTPSHGSNQVKQGGFFQRKRGPSKKESDADGCPGQEFRING